MNTVLIGGLDAKTEIAREVEHARIVLQHLSDDFADTGLAAVANQAREQDAAQATALDVRAYDNSKLGPVPERIAGDARHAQGAARVVDGDEGHLTLVVDLRETGQLGVLGLADHAEKTKPDVLGLETVEELTMGRLVFWTNGPQRDFPLAEGQALDQVGWVRGDGRPRSRASLRASQLHACIEGNHALHRRPAED